MTFRIVRGLAVLLIAVLVVTSVAMPAFAAGLANDDTQRVTGTAFASNSEFINTSDSVSVWKRAGLPLRADASAGVETVDVADVFVDVTTDSNPEASLNKRTVAVYDTSSSIPLHYESRTGANTSQFGGSNVTLLVARLDENRSSFADVSGNETFGLTWAIDRLSGDNLTSEAVNSNFTFFKAGTKQLSASGSVDFNYNPSTPGQYVFLLVRPTSETAGVSVTNGNVSVSGEVQIIGSDAAPVQAASATVTPGKTTYNAGQNVTFDVNSNLGAGAAEVNHSIVVFREDVFKNQAFHVTVNDELDENLSMKNVTVTSSIEGVNGVATTDGQVTVMGTTVGDGRVARTVSITQIVDFVANESSRTTPDTSTTTNAIVMDASAAAVANQGDSTTLTVETFENWSAGHYTYVYVASTNQSDEFATKTGTVAVANRRPVQLSVTANRTSLTVGQAVKLSVTRNGTPVEGATVTIDGRTLTTGGDGAVTVTLATAGNFTAEISKEDTLTEDYLSTNITVTAKSRPPTQGPQPPAGGGGQQSGEDSASVDVVPVQNGATVNVRDAQGGQPVSVPIPNVASEDTAVVGLNLTTTFDEGRFRVEFTKPQRNPPSGTPPVDAELGSAINYFTAEAVGLTDERISEVQFTFTVNQNSLPEGTDPSDVVLFRHHNGKWQTLETVHLGGDRYRATSPGFTVYAIGVRAKQSATTPTDTQPTPTPTPTETPETPTTGTPTEGTDTPGETFLGGGSLGALIAVIVVLVLLVGGFYAYREGHLDELLGR